MWAIFLLIKNQHRHQPPLPPGPLGLPIVGNLLSLDPQLHTYFSTLAQTHGPIFSLRLGTKLGVVISSGALAKEVLKDHDVTFANRDVPIAGKLATYGGLDIVWSPHGSTWRLLRKVCVKEMLGAATLDTLYGLRRREIRSMIREISETSGPVDVGKEAFAAVTRVVIRTLWGGTAAENEERENIESEFRKAVSEFTGLLGEPNISDFIPSLARFDLQGVAKRMNKCAMWLDDIFEKVITQRLNISKMERDSVKDFLEILLRMKDDYEGEGTDTVSFSMYHLKALLMV